MNTTRNVALYIVYSLIIAGLGVTIVLSFQDKSKAKTSHVNGPIVQHSAKAPSSTSSKPASNQSQTLTNTGPGNVIGLFIAASSLFGYLHWRMWPRKSILKLKH